MATVNEVIQDEEIGHAIDLQQYSNGVVRRIVSLLNQVDASLARALAEALDRLPAESFTVERLEALLGEVRALNAQAYASVQEQLAASLQELAAYEPQWQFDLLERVLPEPVKIRFPLVRLSGQQVYAAAMSRPFQGKLLREWAQGLETDRLARIRNAVRIGYVEGKTVDEIVRGIRGTRSALYADGLLNRSRNDLVSVVHTAVGHTAAIARENFYRANENIIKAEDWTSTLDSKTSAPCRIRDKKAYEVGTHKPIGHKIPWLQGPGRIHWRCRSTSTPRTKSWRELGMDIDEMTPGQRASMDGQVPADTTYSQWLSRQSAARQDQVLGPERGRLYREGGMKMEEFYTDRGVWLTIEQLRERDAAAFERIAA